MTASRLIIDIHSHLYPRSYVNILKRRSAPPRITEHDGAEFFVIFDEEQEAGPRGGRQLDESFTDLDEKLKFMDAHGIARTVVSLGNPWLDPFTGDESVEHARTLNEELAFYEVQTHGRVCAMGVLPGNSVEAAVSVANEIARVPTLHGLVTGRRIAGHELDDLRLEPLWEIAEARSLPVLIHPHDSVGQADMRGFGHGLQVALGFPFETTIAVSRLVLAGVLLRHPDLRLLVSHGGGTLPYLAGRLDAGWRSDPLLRDRLPYPPSRDLKKLYLDSIVFHERTLHAAIDLVGEERLLYGTDHPFSIADPEVNSAALQSVAAGMVEQIEHVNALKLFGLRASFGT